MKKKDQLILAISILIATGTTHTMDDDGFDRGELDRAIQASMIAYEDAPPAPAFNGDSDASEEMQRILWQDLAQRYLDTSAVSDDDQLQRIIELSRTESNTFLARQAELLAAEEEEMARAIALSNEMARVGRDHEQEHATVQSATREQEALSIAAVNADSVDAQMQMRHEAFLRRMEEEMHRKHEEGE